MYTLFLVCTALGGTILLLQVGLSLLGLGMDSFGLDFGGHVGDVGGGHVGDLGGGHVGDVGGHVGDVGGGHAGDAVDHAPGDGQQHGDLSRMGRMLTFQTILAFVTFFGVGGLVSSESGHGPLMAVPIAATSGLAAMILIGWALGLLGHLHGDGTLRLDRAVGVRGRVYLRIPGNGAGAGKVTLPVQGRSVVVEARTPGPELRTGEEVVVSRMLDGRIVEVVSAASYAEKPVPLHD